LNEFLEEYLSTESGNKIKNDIRGFKKPSDMSVMMFFQLIQELNKMIEHCPGDEQCYDESELHVILESACPSSWGSDLKKCSDYTEMTTPKMKAYFKLLEDVEGHCTGQFGCG
jgi:hypothetical protein